MSVDEVVLNFRQALVAVVPFFRRAAIPWQRPDAYDEWDEVASALFRALVVEVLRVRPQAQADAELVLPSYDVLADDYSRVNVFVVENSAIPEGRCIFHGFATKSSVFDLVEVRRISEDGRPIGSDLQTCPVEGSAFRLEAGAVRPASSGVRCQ